ncbi:protein NipSnap homolog 3A-like [Diadema antillarum]|uniref:protein NipSnap homolog 3A-like n=1 Tax=Diadema antillarum TaxID=105358 RepID=UPI003A8917C7
MASVTSSLRMCRQVAKSVRWGQALNVACISSSTRHHQDGSSSDPPSDNKFYEFRTYKIKPASFPEFVKLTNEKMHLRTSHSKLIGYWATDIGGLNEVVHIWEYECFAARKAVRAALAVDQTWQSEYFSKALQMFEAQENASMTLLPWKPLQDKPFKEEGVYELRQYILQPKSVELLKPRILLRDEAYTKLGCGKMVGAWIGDLGNANMFYHLYSWESADKRVEARNAVLQMDAFKNLPKCDALTPQMESKLLSPLPFSPLQ